MNENRHIDRTQDRRQFLQRTSVGAVASLVGLPALGIGIANENNGSAKKVKFKLGMASYTLRRFNLDQTLSMSQRLALKYICLKDVHLPLNADTEQIRDTVAKVNEAGLNLYAGGVIYMSNPMLVRQAFAYAQAAGMKIIVGVPNHDLLPLVEEMVRDTDIKVAIHNHGPGDPLYPTPQSVYERIEALDERIGLCLDVGHTMRSGIDPSEPVRQYAHRLLDVHIKDVSAATARGSTMEIGRGLIDIPEFLQTLIDIEYTGIVSFEHEKDERDPLPGVAESVGYVRGVLSVR